MPTPRLPVPGQDGGNWGEILNEFLLVEHNNDGSLKAAPFIAGKANDADVVHKSGTETIDGPKTFSSTPVIPSPSSPFHATNKTYVDASVQTKANSADLATVATSGSYDDLTNKPTVLDTSTFVQLAGTQTITGEKDFTGGLKISGTTVASVNDSRFTDTRTPTDNTVSSAKLQDGSVSEPKLAISNTPTDGDFLSWDGSSLAWEAQTAAPVQSVNGHVGVVSVTKGDVGLGNADNTSDANKPISTATQTALDAKANASATQTALNAKANTADLSTVATTGAYTDLTGQPTLALVATTGAYVSLSGRPTLSTVATSGSYTDLSNQPTIPTAGTGSTNYAAGDDTRITGAVQNSVVTTKGDLLVASGNATVTRVAAGTNNQVLVADDSQAQGVRWADVAAGVGITRTIVTTSANTVAATAAHTDYVYVVSGNHTVTLPTAVGNTNKYTVKNRHTSSISVLFNGSENADGGPVILAPNDAIDLVSSGTNWVII